MRITDSIVFANLLSRSQKLNSNIFQYTEQISSGKRINRASDDPVGFLNLSALKTELANLTQYVKNVTTADNRLESSDSRLSDLTNSLTRVIELNTQAANEQNTGEARAGIAEEIGSIIQEVLGYADAQVGGRALFAGTRDNVSSLSLVNNNPAGRVYSASSVDIQSASAGSISGAVPDPRAFTEHIYQISFTDNAGNFEVRDLDGEGQVVATGTFAAAGDSISVGGVTYTYNGGALAQGDVFTVLPQYSYNGTSTDIPMQIGTNSTITQNVAGTKVFGGTEPTAAGVQQPGGTIFDDLVEFRRALLTDDEPAILSSLDTVHDWYDNLGQMRANVGGRISNLRTLELRGNAEIADLKVNAAGIENVDLAEAITNYSQSQTALGATLQVGALTGRLNLFDYLG